MNEAESTTKKVEDWADRLIQYDNIPSLFNNLYGSFFNVDFFTTPSNAM